MSVHQLFVLILHWVVSAVALLLTTYVVPGFRVRDFSSALMASVVIGIVNAVIGPFLLFLTLPLNMLTLGLFTFVVNAIVLKICAWLLRDFQITSWLSAIVGAVILSFVSG